MSHAPNRLGNEKSPYLLQHALNPVDWFPWGDEAFEKARSEDKPIFLSIGYSTCHWCHVMERESFENAEVAAVLNAHFVPVKLDREERPDIDRVYMTAMQMMGLGGGWPLNVFLTPDLQPFYGGTYFPPQSVRGRIGMLDLLPRVAEAWREQREQVTAQGAQVLEGLKSLSTRAGEAGGDRGVLIERAYDSLARSEDDGYGGFGREPKFPQPSNLAFLFRCYARDPELHREALDMALRQLDAMRLGGIHDHLGGGFHRYATDRLWLVSHFEKMLYDQSQLAWGLLAAYQLTGHAAYAGTARGIFDYVRRDLLSPEGAFYSAEDADSEGEEGRFYVWTPESVAALLPEDDAALFCAFHDITPRGNFEHATSIIHVMQPLEKFANERGLDAVMLAQRFARNRAALLAARSTRIRPHLDDKVLTAWNGLMISAFARGARALGDASLAATALRAGEFIVSRMYDASTGTLLRRWRDGDAACAGQLDDYAYSAYGFLDLYRATLDVAWLERAVALTESLVTRFADDERGGFFESPPGDPHVRVRMKGDHDGAENSGSSIAALVLLALGRLLDRREWLDRAERLLDLYAGRLDHAPVAMPTMLVAMDVAAEAPRHIVVAGSREAPGTRALVAEFDQRYSPEELLLRVDSEDTWQRLGALAPFTRTLPLQRGTPTAYVCIQYACRLPTSDPMTFAAQLDDFLPARPTTGASA